MKQAFGISQLRPLVSASRVAVRHRLRRRDFAKDQRTMDGDIKGLEQHIFGRVKNISQPRTVRLVTKA
jgi:hypothetical protein